MTDLRWTSDLGELRRSLELHLVHLQLLRHRHRIGAVEACAAEFAGGTAADGADEARDGQVVERVGADLLAHLIDGSSGRDELLGRADVHAHEAWEAHGRAGDPHVDLAGAGGAQAFDDAPRGGAAHDRVVDGYQSLAFDRPRQRIELEHDAGFAQRLVGLDEGPVDVTALHHRLAERDARSLRVADRSRRARVGEWNYHVGLDGRLLRELVAHPDARILELAVLEDRVWAREVDELEHAHRVLARRLEADAVNTMFVHHHHLAGLHLAHERRANGVKGACF